VYILSNDNSAIMFSPDGTQISTIYPPPTAKDLKIMQYSIKLKKIFILLASGTICVYSFDQETALLEKLQRPEHIKDQDGKSINQVITTMNFVTVVPPKYDCEVLQDKALNKKEELIENTGEENMIILGFSKGTFAFVSVHQTDKVYARFSIHRQSIVKIEEMNIKGVFLSICSEFIMNIWGFTNDNIVVYRTFKTFRPIKDISFSTENMLASFQSRDSELMFMNGETMELEIVHREKSNEHSGKINCIDSSLNGNLFITGGQDGYVKVWTSDKVLVREI
jgi:WD40 repeat protein